MNQTTCTPLSFLTPNKILLNGLWFGPEHVETAYIFVHGLGSNAFSHHELLIPLSNSKTGVFFFNNRGHDTVTRIKKMDQRKKRGYRSITAGCAHEVFTECVDDLEGALNEVKRRNAKKIILVGHSTGCQKSIYYLSQRNTQINIAGVVLLAPLSDYADYQKFTPPSVNEKLVAKAEDLVKNGKPHQLLPFELFEKIPAIFCDAQRFLSLYTPDSPEEIFCYAQKNKIPKTLQKVKISLLVLLAEHDEYRDRPMKQLANWFTQNNRSKQFAVKIITNASHSFWGKEKKVIDQIRSFVSV